MDQKLILKFGQQFILTTWIAISLMGCLPQDKTSLLFEEESFNPSVNQTNDTVPNCVQERAPLSQSFVQQCASCHGSQGQGIGSIPGLSALKDLSVAQQIVRNGKGAMPAFSPSQIADQVLRSDLLLLQSSVCQENVPELVEITQPRLLHRQQNQ